MVEAFKCSQCSAPIQDDRWTNCPYCGSVLDKPTINPLKAVVARERFESVARSPAFAELMRRTPAGTGTLAKMGFQTVFLIAWTVISVVMFVNFLPAGAMALMPLGMGALGVYLLLRSATGTLRFANAELERHVAVVRDERTEVTGGGEHSSASTQHYLLLEMREGQRIEYGCSSRLAGMLAPGDIGVAYVRGEVLLDFARVDS